MSTIAGVDLRENADTVRTI